MLYWFLTIAVRMALPFFARRMQILNRQMLKEKGPILLACNHPNSFLDAVIVGDFMQAPVHFITRGDVFKKGWIRRTMESINMIPIFRIRDGKDKLSQNEETFQKSIDVLRKGDVLLIFVEGFCENQTELQLPLKKGAPRILQACWQEGIPVRVIPTWLQYSSHKSYSKTIRLSFGQLFTQQDVGDIHTAAGVNKINAICTEQLLHLSHHPPFVHKSPSVLQRILLFIPAMLGAIIHAPLYLPINAVVKKLNGGDVHHDAMTFLFLAFLYPVYVLIIFLAIAFSTGSWLVGAAIAVLMPLTALSYVHWKK